MIKYEIKEYSSKFATKMNYVLDLLDITPLQYGRAKAIELITNEKDSTVNNWLFNNRYPRSNKRLAIADSIGVSHNYLFDDSIEITQIKKPEIFEDNQFYLVPFIDETDIFKLKNNLIFPIKIRFPIMFPNFSDLLKKYGTNIYITKINNGIFEPYVQHNSNIIYSENLILEDFTFVLHNDSKNNLIVVKRVIYENNNLFLEFIDQKKKLVREPIDVNNKMDNFVSIILTFSK